MRGALECLAIENPTNRLGIIASFVPFAQIFLSARRGGA
jgi:hypothetical protein